MLVTNANAEQAVKEISDSPEIAIDVEATGVNPWTSKNSRGDKVCGFAVYNGSKSWYVPTSHSYGANVSPEAAMDLVRATHKVRVWRNHNLPFDVMSLGNTFGEMHIPEVFKDSMVVLHVYNENEESKALKRASDKYLGTDSSKDEKELMHLLKTWGYGKQDMWRMDPSLVAPYAITDTKLAWDLGDHLRAKMEPEEAAIATEVEEFSRLLTEMMVDGVYVNRHMCQKYYNEAAEQCELLKRSVRSKYGFDVTSPQSIMGKYGTMDSTYETLMRYAKDKPGISEVIEYRAWQVARDTYYKAYLKEFISDDSRIHANIRVTGTISGRISIRDPALQALPRYSKEQKVKDIIEAPDGWNIAELDYSQAEIRLGAHYTKDQEVIKTLADGGDIHQMVADAINEPRPRAKTINFSIIYGSGAMALAESLNITLKEAHAILKKYHDRFPGYRLLSKSAEKVATERGYIKLWTGRRRHFNVLEAETRKAFSNLIQGGVAEIIRRAMTRARREIPRDRLRIVLQVHDSLLVYYKDIDSLMHLRYIMEDNPWCLVPTKVDVKVGKSWGSAKEMNK